MIYQEKGSYGEAHKEEEKKKKEEKKSTDIPLKKASSACNINLTNQKRCRVFP